MSWGEGRYVASVSICKSWYVKLGEDTKVPLFGWSSNSGRGGMGGGEPFWLEFRDASVRPVKAPPVCSDVVWAEDLSIEIIFSMQNLCGYEKNILNSRYFPPNRKVLTKYHTTFHIYVHEDIDHQCGWNFVFRWRLSCCIPLRCRDGWGISVHNTALWSGDEVGGGPGVTLWGGDDPGVGEQWWSIALACLSQGCPGLGENGRDLFLGRSLLVLWIGQVGGDRGPGWIVNLCSSK